MSSGREADAYSERRVARLWREDRFLAVERSLTVLALDQVATLCRSGRDAIPGLIVLADCRGATDLQRCHQDLNVVEARVGLAEGKIGIVASACDSAGGYIALRSLAGRSDRLVGMTWDRNAFVRDLACDPEAVTVEIARCELVIAARAADVPAYDWLAGEVDGVDEFEQASRALGFSGIMVPV